ncbi:MAG: permease-like cell division protein FtsX [Acutalibacteraceae bacterium]|nr:permease-like cell division protein FtsX [Acutalibacteraceae bacterium]
MKLRSLSYLSKEGIKNMWANRLMTAASIGVLVACMVLIGLAVLISLNLNMALGNLEQQNVIRVFFNDKTSVIYGNASEEIEEGADTSEGKKIDPDEIPDDAYFIHNEEEALALCEKLSKIDNVLGVQYVSGEQALEDIKNNGQIPEGTSEFFNFEDEYGNPLSSGAVITLKNMSDFGKTLDAIKNTEGVDAVQSHSDLAEKINAIKSGIGIAGVWIIAILLIIALVIVSNTIRVTMYSRKLEISIMKAVGATNSFIRLPFVIEGVMIGLVSAVISLAILYFCYRVAIESIGAALGMMNTIAFGTTAPYIFGIFAAIGILSGVLGSAIMISKYLRKEGSEFTAI